LTPTIFSDLVDIFLPNEPRQKVLFLLGGRRPDAEWLRRFAVSNEPEVWAVDGGVGACRKAGIVPGVVIGDMDSAEPGDLAWAREAGARVYTSPRDKDLTDFQLAIDMLGEENQKDKARALLLSGCFGGRLDHLFSVMCTFAVPGSLCMIDDREGVLLIASGEARAVFRKRPLAVSLLPLSEECKGVSISGVKWPLSEVSLTRRRPWAISNEALRDDVTVSCVLGLLGFYWNF
jgi:thiamine pyrophosphokinase